LPLFRAAAQQDHKRLSVLAEVNAVAGTEVDPAFKNARTDAFHFREISMLHPHKRNGCLGGGRCVEPFEPVGERFVSVLVNVAAQLDHQIIIVTFSVPSNQRRPPYDAKQSTLRPSAKPWCIIG
jgi:hypothetical protein